MKKIYKDEEIPVYEIYIEDGDATGIRFVSLVDKPAIELKGMAFNEQNKIKSFDFKADKDMQVIVGPAMVPGKKILRKDEDGNKYYVVFTKETIRQMVQKFNSQGTNRRINIDHSPKMASAYIMENWIVEDEYYDKSRKYGFEVPVGTWMLSVKVDDEKFWKDEVKDGGKYGFSVEGIMGQKPMSYKLQEISLNDYIDALTEDEIVNLFSAVNDDLVLDFFASTGQVIEEGMTFADEGDDFEPSKRVYVYALKPGVEGPFIKENSRPFCEYMHKINRFWTEDEINVLSTKLGYDFWQYFGSYNCRHTLKPVILTKNTNPASASDMDTAVEKQAEAGLLGFNDMKECDCEECKKEQAFVMERKSGESESDFLGRCIPYEINNGYEQRQAIAICYNKLSSVEHQFKCPPEGDGKNKDGSDDKRCKKKDGEGQKGVENVVKEITKKPEIQIECQRGSLNISLSKYFSSSPKYFSINTIINLI